MKNKIITLVALISFFVITGLLINKFGIIGAGKITNCYRQVTNVKCPNGTLCMTNPASSFCKCMGGITRIKNTDAGQQGMCDIGGKETNEWEFFRTNTKNLQK
ncbi:MAG: DUF333 domain-containing protein [Patescibacteria group bacterium]